MISHDRWAVLELDRDVRDMLAGLDTVLPEPFHRLGVAGARRAVAALRPSTGDPVAEVSEVSIPGRHGPIPARIYRPEDAAGSSIVYFHGGGWTMGGLDGADACCRRLANLTRSTVISVDYRLAPEHPFPAAIDDTRTAHAWLVENADRLGIDSRRIAVGGDSAGGGLAALCLDLRSRGLPQPALQVLVYPAVDDSFARLVQSAGSRGASSGARSDPDHQRSCPDRIAGPPTVSQARSDPTAQGGKWAGGSDASPVCASGASSAAVRLPGDWWNNHRAVLDEARRPDACP